MLVIVMVSEEVVKKLMESNDEELEAVISAEEDALIGELDEDISRAATSWNPAYPGRKEVSHEVAKQARKIMHLARVQCIRPSAVKGAIEDYERFFLAVDGLRLSLPRLSCNRCGHTWSQRKADLPKNCPGCKSPYWNKDRVRQL